MSNNYPSLNDKLNSLNEQRRQSIEARAEELMAGMGQMHGSSPKEDSDE